MKFTELRDISEVDLKMVLNWRNKESVRNMMYHSDKIQMEQHIAWYEDLKKNQTKITKIFYYNTVPCGVVNVNQIDKTNNTCKWGFYIGIDNSPKGLGTILGFTALNYIFNDLSIRKLTAEVLSINEKSLKFHEKLGFTQEGILHKQLLRGNTYIDVFLYRLFLEEWTTHALNVERIIEGW